MRNSFRVTVSRQVMRLVSLCLLAVTTTVPVRATTPPGVIGCHPKAKPVCEALNIEDPEQRRVASWRAIREAFLSSDPEVRSAALKELSLRSYKMDLTPYLPLIDEFGPAIDAKGAAQLGDRIEIEYGARASRVELLGQAIRSGRVTQRRGTEIPRFVAAYWAAYQGLSELRAMALEYLDTLPPQAKRRQNLDAIPGLFELCDGSQYAGDCPRIAAARLDDVDPGQLRDRLNSDYSFWLAIRHLRNAACALGLPHQSACDAFRSLLPSQEDQLEVLREGLGTPPRIRWIDPCTVPELAEHWVQGWVPASPHLIDTSRSTPEGSAGFVSLVDGITGHRSGELIRLRISVRGRAGEEPTEPIAVRVEVKGPQAGWISPPGLGLRCRSIQFLWNHPESGEGVIPVFQEFDYQLVGHAEIAGLVPLGGSEFRPVWKSADSLKISIGKLKDYGETIEHISDRIWEIRPEGNPPSSWKPIVERLQAALRSNPTKAVLLDAEATRPSTFVTVKPTRALVAMICEGDRTRRVLVSSVRQDGTKLSDGIPVDLFLVADSRICIGSFTLVPERASVDGLSGPFVEVPLGSGNIEVRSETGKEP